MRLRKSFNLSDPDPAGIGFGLNPPMGTHFLYGRVGDTRVIGTFFTWESDFLHRDSILQNLHTDKYKQPTGLYPNTRMNNIQILGSVLTIMSDKKNLCDRGLTFMESQSQIKNSDKDY